jgi:hypothetical protein
MTPASALAIKNVPEFTVTAETLFDFDDRGSDKCGCCLEKMIMSTNYLILPCGHMFHKLCAKDVFKKTKFFPFARYGEDTGDEVQEDPLVSEDSIRFWLRRSNTCPICRFEVATMLSSHAHQDKRAEDMRGILSETLFDALVRDETWDNTQLKGLCDNLYLPTSSCVTKKNYLAVLALSGYYHLPAEKINRYSKHLLESRV